MENKTGSKGRGRTTEIKTFQPELPEEKDLINIDDALYNEIRGAANSKWPVEAKMLACTYYLMRGSYNKTAKDMATTEYPVPKQTIAAWCNKSSWWKELTHRIRRANDAKLDAKMTGIIHKATEELEERVENGNHRVGKDGKLIRVPMNSTELARDGIGILYDKRALGRGESVLTQSNDTAENALEKIMEKLKKIGEQTIDAKKVEELTTPITTEYKVEDG